MILAVTVTFNSHCAGILPPFLASWRSQREVDAELLIIDNASTDGTVEFLSNLDNPRISVLLNDANIGFAAACNQAIGVARQLNATHLLLLNHDTEFGPTLLRDLLAAGVESDADAISPVITYYDEPDLVWFAGGSFSPLLGMIPLHERKGRPVCEVPVAVFSTSFAPGCCLLIRMSAFATVGEFDASYFVYWEDADFCLRMSRHGLHIVVAPALRLLHKESVTTGGSHSDFSLRMGHRNHIYFLRKNFGLWLAVAVLPIQLLKALINIVIGRKSLRQIRKQVRAVREGFGMPVHGLARFSR